MSEQPRGIVPHLVVDNAAAAIDYYRKALGAEEVMRMPTDDGKELMHAQIRVGESAVYLCDDFPEYHGGKSSTPKALGGTSVTIHRTIPDCYAAIKRCTDAGAKITMPATDMFWGDRYGKVTDPFGHLWSFSTPLKK
ncbi:VOC family protein [soil metagenome]